MCIKYSIIENEVYKQWGPDLNPEVHQTYVDKENKAKNENEIRINALRK